MLHNIQMKMQIFSIQITNQTSSFDMHQAALQKSCYMIFIFGAETILVEYLLFTRICNQPYRNSHNSATAETRAHQQMSGDTRHCWWVTYDDGTKIK